MANSISVERTCISVSDNYEAESKACIKVSSNAGTCPTVQGWIISTDANLEVPILQKMKDFNCTTYTYLISNFQNKATYYTKMNYGDLTYLSDGEMLYKPPRVNVPTEDLVLCVWASYGSNTTEEVCVKPEKLAVTPKPILGTPSEQYAYNDADITIPITNYLVGESVYTPVLVDNGYATIVDGVITWSFDLSVEYGKTYTLAFRGYNNCHSESELCTFEIQVRRYEYMNDLPLEDGTTCPPLCAEGWYFDCATETCKKYSQYRLNFEQLTLYTKSIGSGGQITELSLTDSYPIMPNSITVDALGTVGYRVTLDLLGTATFTHFSMSATAIKGIYDTYLGAARDAGNDYIAADPWGTYWWDSFPEYSEVLEVTITLAGSVEGIK